MTVGTSRAAKPACPEHAACPHDDGVDELLLLLPALVSALREAVPHGQARERLSDIGLTARQMTALVQLELAGEQTMSDFAAGMGVSRATATDMVERLQERGLVTRRHARQDRRVIMVQLSDAARAHARAILDRRRRDLQRALERQRGLSARTVAGFLRALIDELGRE